MKKLLLLAVLAAFVVTLFTGCSGLEAQNKDSLKDTEKAKPVKSRKISKKKLFRENVFYSRVSGIEETFASSYFAEKVDKILVNIGDKVKKDQVVLTFPKDTPGTQYFQAKVSYENSKAQYERLERLYKIGGISLQQRDNAYTKFKVDKANWQSVKEGVDIKAPISGVVTEILVNESDNVDAEQKLLIISNTDKLKAVVWVSERYIDSVSKGDKVFAVWEGKRAEGRVASLAHSMNKSRMAFRAVIEIDNSEGLIKAGVIAEIRLISSQKTSSLVLPRSALIQKGDEYGVFVKTKGRAVKKEVKLGRNSGLDVEIVHGINEGEEVIFEGFTSLQNNDRVYEVK